MSFYLILLWLVSQASDSKTLPFLGETKRIAVKSYTVLLVRMIFPYSTKCVHLHLHGARGCVPSQLSTSVHQKKSAHARKTSPSSKLTTCCPDVLACLRSPVIVSVRKCDHETRSMESSVHTDSVHDHPNSTVHLYTGAFLHQTLQRNLDRCVCGQLPFCQISGILWNGLSCDANARRAVSHRRKKSCLMGMHDVPNDDACPTRRSSMIGMIRS